MRFYPTTDTEVTHRIEYDIAEPAQGIRTGVRVLSETIDTPGSRSWFIEVREGVSGEWTTLRSSNRRLDTHHHVSGPQDDPMGTVSVSSYVYRWSMIIEKSAGPLGLYTLSRRLRPFTDV